MVRSFRIELALSKPEILRCYLDRVPMGNNLMGVESAAQLYFGKPAAQLNVGEAALLAALTRAPGTLNPYGPHLSRLLRRQEQVLQRLVQLGLLSPGSWRPPIPSGCSRPGAGFPGFPSRRPTLPTWSWLKCPRPQPAGPSRPP